MNQRTPARLRHAGRELTHYPEYLVLACPARSLRLYGGSWFLGFLNFPFHIPLSYYWQRYLQRKKWLLIGLLIVHTVGIAQRDTTEAQVEKSPSKAVLYSLIPGGGQVYNGKYLKAILIMSAGAYSAYNFILNRNLYLDKDPNLDPVNRSRYRERRNKFAWWIGFVYIYGLIDAMVDSHLAAYEDDGFDELPIETDKDQNKSELFRR